MELNRNCSSNLHEKSGLGQEIMGRVPKSLTHFYIFLNLLLVGGIGITSKIDFSQFFCWNKDCSDYGIKNQGNIVFKEIYGKNNQALLKFKTCMHYFCETKGTIFFGLDTPEEAVLRTSYDS
ncbi:MAG: hypothetical protein ACYDEF_02635 [Methanosarcina sp.]|nr:hypothetical protein BGV40_07235 [Methanosarcina sp. Ant1]